ncbi:hypothetical protein D3C85_1509730 [compost metagenome]
MQTRSFDKILLPVRGVGEPVIIKLQRHRHDYRTVLARFRNSSFTKDVFVVGIEVGGSVEHPFKGVQQRCFSGTVFSMDDRDAGLVIG